MSETHKTMRIVYLDSITHTYNAMVVNTTGKQEIFIFFSFLKEYRDSSSKNENSVISLSPLNPKTCVHP